MTLLLIALAGGVGAAARFLTDTWVAGRLQARLPAGTIIVNVSGSLLLGLLTGWVGAHGDPGDVKAVLGTGLLGGYTTFSTASVEAVRLLRGGREVGAVTHALAMLVLSVAAALIGLELGGL